jgi:hypothetical protein
MKIYEVRAAIEHERFGNSSEFVCIKLETNNGEELTSCQHTFVNDSDLRSNFEFATCEDSDFSFRLLNAGLKIEAYHIPVHHLNSKTR